MCRAQPTHVCSLLGSTFILLMYVNDTLNTGSDTNSTESAIAQPKNRFEIVDLGETYYLLSLKMKRQEETVTIEPSQETYARHVYEKCRMIERRPTWKPAEVGPTSTLEELLSKEFTTYFREAEEILSCLGR